MIADIFIHNLIIFQYIPTKNVVSSEAFKTWGILRH